MKINRIVITILVILALIIFYEVRLKPQSRPLYESALVLYRQGKYNASLLDLQRAYQIEPNSTAILVLMGWNQLKLREYEQARENFGRAARLDPALTEAKLGLAYVALETGQGEAPVAGVQAMLDQDPSNRDFQLASAVALRQAGHNLKAAEIFLGLEGVGKYGEVAHRNLVEMYGLDGLDEPIPRGVPPLRRSSQLEVNLRATGNQFQHRSGGSWAPFYIKGINLGPAVPGAFPSEAPERTDRYLEWLRDISQSGANTIRAYNLLPPAFYRALKTHNEKTQLPRLYLLQQIWLVGQDDRNWFQQPVIEQSQAEIRNAIDVIHGHGDVPMRKGRASGFYLSDVSAYTAGLVLGRVLEPHLVIANNELNAFRKSHKGKYVSVEEGSPSEVWLAALADYAVNYEVETYNQQHPVGILNWPGLDPLSHPTEAGLVEEMGFRRRMGEKVGSLSPDDPIDDNDAVSVDERHLQASPAFQAGLFSAYHVYPFYPDFLLNDPGLLRTRDHIGPNSYFGYLKALKAHYSGMPLLITEYGVPTSLGVSHFHPNGWNQGGLTENEQGEALARMTRNIADAGCAGGIVFEWQDEWFQRNWLTSAFEIPEQRGALWFNALNPGENFGIWTYDPSQSRLFSSDTSGWRSLKPLYEKSARSPAYPLQDGADALRNIRSLSVSSDEAFLYLRLQLESLQRGADGSPKLDQANYLIGMSTRPGAFGGRIVPGFLPQVRYSGGLNFLLHIAGTDDKARLLVASNYNPYGLFPVEGVSGRTHLGLHRPWKPQLEDWSPFEEMVVEPNRMRFSRDGTAFPQKRYSRSPLRYRPLDSSAAQQDSLGTWSADYQSNALIFRLPWGLLFVTDPSSRMVYAGAEPNGKLLATGTDGIGLFALSFRPGASAPNLSRFPSVQLGVTDALPAVDAQGTLSGARVYSWERWNAVQVKGRPKASAKLLEKSFREIKSR